MRRRRALKKLEKRVKRKEERGAYRSEIVTEGSGGGEGEVAVLGAGVEEMEYHRSIKAVHRSDHAFVGEVERVVEETAEEDHAPRVLAGELAISVVI